MNWVNILTLPVDQIYNNICVKAILCGWDTEGEDNYSVYRPKLMDVTPLNLQIEEAFHLDPLKIFILIHPLQAIETSTDS